MAFEIIVKPIVWFDLLDAVDWYENEMPGLGKRFLNSFEQAKKRIQSNPNGYLNVTSGIKRILTKNFPYKVFYTFSDDTIFIIGVMHVKRSNTFVTKRLKSF
jgi:plasmid stabilization system protein ParE